MKLNPQQERNILNELEDSYQYHVNTGGFSEPTRVKGSDKLETWVITENFYPGWEKFLKLFDIFNLISVDNLPLFFSEFKFT